MFLKPHVILQKHMIIEDGIPAGYKSCKEDYVVKIYQYQTRQAITYKDLAWENLPIDPGIFVSYRLFHRGKWGKENFLTTIEQVRMQIMEEAEICLSK